jgi:hypothetical protein
LCMTDQKTRILIMNNPKSQKRLKKWQPGFLWLVAHQQTSNKQTNHTKWLRSTCSADPSSSPTGMLKLSKR